MDHVALADQRPARVATGPFAGSAGGGRIARALQLGLDILGASLELGEWELWKMCMQEPILCEVTERNPEHETLRRRQEQKKVPVKLGE